MDGSLKILLGIAIIIASFYYVVKNKRPMLDNMIEKSNEKYQKEYEQQEAIKAKARAVVDGKADAFDTLTEGAKAVAKPAVDMAKKEKTEEAAEA